MKLTDIILLSVPLNFEKCDAVLETVFKFAQVFKFSQMWVVDDNLQDIRGNSLRYNSFFLTYFIYNKEWNGMAISSHRCSFPRLALGVQSLVYEISAHAKKQIYKYFNDSDKFDKLVCSSLFLLLHVI